MANVENVAERRKYLNEIMLASENMLRKAREGEWLKVQELEEKRRELLSQCFSKKMLPELQGTTKEVLDKLIDTEIELIRISTEENADYQNQITDFKIHQHAATVYSKDR